jgi:polyphenol oxidase
VILTRAVGPATVRCSGRAQGNVGDHVGDDPHAVAQHRAGIAASAGLPVPTDWVWLRQVHGAAVHEAGGPTPPEEPPVADAAVTAIRGLPLAIVTADCAPVVLANDDAIGVVHAGHRGLLAGVIEAAVTRVRGLGEGEVHAFLGPCIRPLRYEFGARDLEVLASRLGDEVKGRTRDGRPALDIPAAVRIALCRAGVTQTAPHTSRTGVTARPVGR